MARRIWVLNFDTDVHVVELGHRVWSGVRAVALDGKLVSRSVDPVLGGSVHSFRIDERPCAVLVRPRILGFDYDLVVDGVSVRTGLHPAMDAPTEVAPVAPPPGRGNEVCPRPGWRAFSRLRRSARFEMKRCWCGAHNPEWLEACSACAAPLPGFARSRGGRRQASSDLLYCGCGAPNPKRRRQCYACAAGMAPPGPRPPRAVHRDIPEWRDPTGWSDLWPLAGLFNLLQIAAWLLWGR